jgi:diaminopimelate epimerase
LVITVPDVDDVDLMKWGPNLRQHPDLGTTGANVDWVLHKPRDGEYRLRTYERGVEGETLACGTGAAAAAVVLCRLGLASSPVVLRTRGEDRLVVTVNLNEHDPVLQLRGPAEVSFAGEVEIYD